MNRDELETIAKRILKSAFAVHETIGPGLLEKAYVACLIHELQSSGLRVSTEVPVPVIYKGLKMADVGYRLDILVENEIVIEVKALEAIHPVHVAQLVSYLRLTDRRLGFLLNFNVALMKQGIYRRVNHL